VIEDLSQAKYEIEAFLSTNERWLCFRDGAAAGEVNLEGASVSVEFGKLILSLWGEDFSESWRVEGYEITSGRLILQLSRQLGRLGAVVEFRSPGEEVESSGWARQRRSEFEKIVCRLIEGTLGAKIERVTTHRDAARQLSGIYTRLILNKAGERIVAAAVNSSEAQREIDGVLTAGLIWLDRAGRLRSAKRANRLLLFVPSGKADHVAGRMTALRQDNGLSVELFEVNEKSGEIGAVRPFDQGELFDPVKHRLPKAVPELQPNPLRDRVLALAPGVIRLYRRPGSSVDSFRVRGLEVARLTSRGLLFGVGSKKRRCEDEWGELESFVGQVLRLRRADGEEKFHPFYRLQAERWLEEVIREDVKRLDARLDPRFIYPQIPAHRNDDYAMVDVLGITEDGQLVIIELKVADDIELPMQAIDYWLKVEWHRRRGDFERRGYFPGVKIADRPAMVLLVSPLLRFHRTFNLIAGWIHESIPVYKVGITEEWRRGIKVVRRERANG
jgi:hypothetical protein